MPTRGEPVFKREVHDLDDLLAVDLAERPAEHGRVLAEDADRAAVDRAEAGDDAVAERTVLVDPEVAGAVAGQRVGLGEAARVEQRLDPLPRRALAEVAPLGDRGLGAGVQRLGVAALELDELPGRPCGCRDRRRSRAPRSVLLPWGERLVGCTTTWIARRCLPAR